MSHVSLITNHHIDEAVELVNSAMSLMELHFMGKPRLN